MRHTLFRVEFAVSVAAFLPGTVFYVTGRPSNGTRSNGTRSNGPPQMALRPKQ
jgi:hypothetical protein